MLVNLIYIMSTFTDGIIDFRFVALQLYEEFTEVGSNFGILLLNCINTGVSMNLFLLYFGVLYYILYFMGLDFFVLNTLQYPTGGPRPASKLRSLFYVCTLHCVLQSLLIHNDRWNWRIWEDLRSAGGFLQVIHTPYPNWFEGRLKFNLPYVDSGMFYDDFGRLNFNPPTASYKFIKSYLSSLAYVRYRVWVHVAYSIFEAGWRDIGVIFLNSNGRWSSAATKLAGKVDWISIYHR